MACLRVVDGPDKGQVYELILARTAIGRSLDNHIALSDMSASRSHAEVEKTPQGFLLNDLNSSHGVFLNGARLSSKQVLKPADTIRIGSTELIFEEASNGQAHMPELQEVPENTPIFSDLNRTITLAVSVEEAHSREYSLPKEKAAALLEIAEAIRSVFDADELLPILMKLIIDLFKPDRGVLLLRDASNGQLAPRITWPESTKAQVSHTILDYAILERKSLLISDAGSDERFSGAQSIMAQDIHWAICSPLIFRDTVYGALYIDAHRPQMVVYDKNDVALLNIIASQAAIALENAALVQEKIQAERMAAIGVAIAGISHYVKNLLFGVSGSAGLIDKGIEQNSMEMVSKIWPVMKRSTGKITTLIQDMLTYSKKREPDWAEGNLNSLLSEVYESQMDRASAAKVELSMSLDYSVPDSFFDPRTIHDAVLNLVGNAIEACAEHEGATVEVSTKMDAANQMQSICIQDTGPGIPFEIQRRIFEPFFSTKGSKGTGLGLAVARKSIEEHGGRLELRSAPNEGATFTVTLPVRTTPPADSTETCGAV